MYDVLEARAGLLPALACLCVALAACGGAGDTSTHARTPVPAPRVSLSAADRARWAPGAPRREAVPVLLHRGLTPAQVARELVLLRHAGYDTISLDELVGFVHRKTVALPSRPLLLTFDGGSREPWTSADSILRDLDFEAALFVDVGRIERGDPAALTWPELARMQDSGRWDVQLQSGTGHRRIRWGPSPRDVGAFYAYRGSEEVLGGWRERVFSDVTYGEDQLTHHVPGYRPLAFAPPYGNYGQAGTNDRRIPRLLLARLELSFPLVFTQDRDAFAAPGARNPLGRVAVTPHTGEAELHALLTTAGRP